MRRLACKPSPFTTHKAIMTTLQRPTLIVAALFLSLSFAATQVRAQAAPAKPAPAKPSPAKPAANTASKTLSGKTPGGGQLMTRDELRSCLKRRDGLSANVKDIEGQRVSLDRERAELKAEGDKLLAEHADLDRQLAAVREWETKVRAYTADVEAFNKRSAAVQEALPSRQEKMAKDLAPERDRLDKVRVALAAEEAAVVAPYKAVAATYNERAQAREVKASDWNARNAAAAEASLNQQDERQLWLNECANRPYLEDDEAAIKAGK
jgi:hypothetical protein